jgi:hypothetical protein
LPAVAPPPRVLTQRNEPIAFDGTGVREQGTIGRAKLLDDPDTAQNSDPAALSVIVVSDPMRK